MYDLGKPRALGFWKDLICSGDGGFNVGTSFYGGLFGCAPGSQHLKSRVLQNCTEQHALLGIVLQRIDQERLGLGEPVVGLQLSVARACARF